MSSNAGNDSSNGSDGALSAKRGDGADADGDDVLVDLDPEAASFYNARKAVTRTAKVRIISD